MGEMQHLACFLSRHEKTLVIVIGLLLMYTLTCGIFLMNWADHHVNPVAPSHAQVKSAMGGRHFIQALKLSAKNNFCDSRDPLRYRRLKKELVKNKSYIMIAFNLFNNQEVVPDFIIQLESLIRFIGVQNVFVAAYENGSNDQTKTYMELLHGFLQDASVANSIHYSFKSKDPNLHRIDLLSHVRNQALEPLFQGTVPRHVDKVLFLNDVFFCADDMKELLHQSIIQKADLTCGLDFDTDNDGVGFYDTWVGRDMHGAMFNKRPYKSFSINPETNDRLKDDLPVQVYCCWNGAAVVNANAFYEPNNVRFHRTLTSKADEKKPEVIEFRRTHNNNGVLYSSCSGSEMNNFCHDLHEIGLEKAVIIPSVKLAYDWATYSKIRGELSPMDQAMSPLVDVPISYIPPPEASVCLPMNGKGLRSPDGAFGWELLSFRKSKKD